MDKRLDDFSVKPQEDNYSSQYFTVIGNHDYLDDDKNPRLNEDNEDSVMAEKVIYKDGREAYYARVGAYGKLYNPIGMFTEGRMKKYLAKFGKREWTLKKVNPKVFEFYVSFLRTKNLAWFNNAEREME